MTTIVPDKALRTFVRRIKHITKWATTGAGRGEFTRSAIRQALLTASGTLPRELLEAFFHQAWLIECKIRTDAEWVAVVSSIEDPQTMAKVASIVYWDCDADLPRLAGIMNQYDAHAEDDEHQIHRALRLIGYPEQVAARRCRQPKDSHYRRGK